MSDSYETDHDRWIAKMNNLLAADPTIWWAWERWEDDAAH